VDDPGRFDERIAAVYDDYKDDPTRTEFGAEDIEATVEFLAQLAAEGGALEFGGNWPGRAPSGDARRSDARNRYFAPHG
jgi:hypothetical protein